MKPKTTPDERLRLDALRYRALRHDAIAPVALDHHADWILERLSDEGLVLDFVTPDPNELFVAVEPDRRKRKWSKQRREKHAKRMAERKAAKESSTLKLVRTAGKRTEE